MAGPMEANIHVERPCIGKRKALHMTKIATMPIYYKPTFKNLLLLHRDAGNHETWNLVWRMEDSSPINFITQQDPSLHFGHFKEETTLLPKEFVRDIMMVKLTTAAHEQTQ